MDRKARLQSARAWVSGYSGRDIVRGYRKWFGVSTVCAIIELRQLGVSVPAERLEQAKLTEKEAALANARKRARRKQLSDAADKFVDSDETFSFIAGYTEGGAPYGIRWDDEFVSSDESVRPR